MSSSREEAMSRLRKWEAAKTPIKASFLGKGLSFNATGRIVFQDASKLRLVVKNGFVGSEHLAETVALSLDLGLATPCETFEPMLDAPDDEKLRYDFLVAEAFDLPCGNLDFREMAGDGAD
jgi:hypothetical protein